MDVASRVASHHRTRTSSDEWSETIVKRFEVKSHRRDWLSELRQPEKAEEIARFCHRWWLTADVGVVELSELPPAWGLLLPKGRGLTIARPADLRYPDEPTWPFLASIFRKVAEASVPVTSIEDRLEKRFLEGREAEAATAKHNVGNHERLAQSVKEFEEASGLQIPQ